MHNEKHETSSQTNYSNFSLMRWDFCLLRSIYYIEQLWKYDCWKQNRCKAGVKMDSVMLKNHLNSEQIYCSYSLTDMSEIRTTFWFFNDCWCHSYKSETIFAKGNCWTCCVLAPLHHIFLLKTSPTLWYIFRIFHSVVHVGYRFLPLNCLWKE